MDVTNYKPKINRRNKLFIEKLRDYSSKYSIIGIIDVEGLPALQFQRIRSSLNKTAKVLIIKKNLIEIVLNELEDKRPGIKELIPKMSGIVGLVFTNNNPFTLYKFVKKSKSPAPAKAGQIAPKDIIVPAGPTGFAPGPIIGELGSFKIKAGINAGKVEIKEDSLVVKEGETISAKLAGILTRLQIEPMEVGLNIKGIYEEGVIYTRNVLDINEDEILEQLKTCVSDSFKLSVGIEYPTKENITHLIGNNSRDSLSLGVGICWPEAQTISRLLSKANSQMVGVSLTLPEGLRPAGIGNSIPVASENSSFVNEESKTEKTDSKKSEEDVASGFGGFF